MKKLTLVVALVAMAGVASAQLVNGGFESGDLTGWSDDGNPGGTKVVNSDYANSGTYSLAIDSTGAGGWSSPNVFQSIAATPGQVASMDGFMLQTVAAQGLNWATIKLEWKDAGGLNIEPGAGVLDGAIDGGGQPYVGVIGLPQVNSGAAVGSWVGTSLSAVAPAGTVAANFYLLNVNGDVIADTFYFDDISASVVPEPATIGLVGIAGLGMFVARRRFKI